MGFTSLMDTLKHFNHEEARSVLILAIGSAMPFLLRTAGEKFFSRCKKYISNNIAGTGKSTAYIYDMMNDRPSWKKTSEGLGLGCCSSLFIAVIRLIFWHWMQPLLYFFVFYAYYGELDQMQQIFGFGVALREAIYFSMTIICIFVNPAYLLADLIASWKKNDIDDKMSVIVYTLAPEKYVLMCILDVNFEGCSLYCLVILSILDFFGIAAFVSAFIANNVHIPMMIGYGLTTLGAFVCAVFWIYAQICFKPPPSAKMSVDFKKLPSNETMRKKITKRMPSRPLPKFKSKEKLLNVDFDAPTRPRAGYNSMTKKQPTKPLPPLRDSSTSVQVR